MLSASWLFGFLTSWLAATHLACRNEACPGLVTKPEPRTEAWNVKFAEKLAQEVRQADAGEGLELIFYGDSITEQWRGTDQDGRCDRCRGDPKTFEEYFGRYRSDVLAVGGDQIGHLMWRLLNGDIPSLHEPKVVVVMIGTNDFGAVSACSHGNASSLLHASKGVMNRLTQTIQMLRLGMPNAQILFLGILPRGDGTGQETTFVWPGIYTAAIDRVNLFLEDYALIDSHVSYLDCGPELLVHGRVTPERFGDGLHPTQAGMKIMAKCIAPVVYNLMGASASDISKRNWPIFS